MKRIMENHNKHMFIHKNFFTSITIKKDETLLPKDRRRKPYYQIKKMQLENVKTWGDFHSKRFDFIKNKEEGYLREHINQNIF